MKNILIVSLFTDKYEEILKIYDFNLSSASSTKEAKGFFFKDSNFDLIIFDIPLEEEFSVVVKFIQKIRETYNGLFVVNSNSPLIRRKILSITRGGYETNALEEIKKIIDSI